MKPRNLPDGTPPGVFVGVHAVCVCRDLLLELGVVGGGGGGGAVEVAAWFPITL